MSAYVGFTDWICPKDMVIFYYIECKKCKSISFGQFFYCECGSRKLRIMSDEQVAQLEHSFTGAVPDSFSDVEFGFLLEQDDLKDE